MSEIRSGASDESILTSIKKLIGITEVDTSFDMDIIVHINGAISNLRQIGIGPLSGFRITDKSSVWSDLIGESLIFESVKDYIYYKVKLAFDPPQSSSAIESIKALADECEWRLGAASASETILLEETE